MKVFPILLAATEKPVTRGILDILLPRLGFTFCEDRLAGTTSARRSIWRDDWPSIVAEALTQPND
jgi:hypothetical protein